RLRPPLDVRTFARKPAQARIRAVDSRPDGCLIACASDAVNWPIVVTRLMCARSACARRNLSRPFSARFRSERSSTNATCLHIEAQSEQLHENSISAGAGEQPDLLLANARRDRLGEARPCRRSTSLSMAPPQSRQIELQGGRGCRVEHCFDSPTV